MPYSETVLKRRVRYEGELAYVEMRPRIEATLRREHLDMLCKRWPAGCLRLDPNGKGRRYVRLSWPRGGNDRLSVARIILSFIGEGEQATRQVVFRNRNPLDLRPSNITLGSAGRSRSDDRAHQEAARRGWLINQKRTPDSRRLGEEE